uniref:hypothetical protein n=1 Tax=Alistipes putredinis TaxID=28117 RepID=UPI003FD8BFA8
MSDFVQQQHTICNFSNEGSWVILSPIEQSIKQKIESVGTPLKDWDIKIYRGVLTGYNDAFIISTEKRDEILANCQTEDERLRTAELIRPILRGRDIKRYGYDWANLWLIATFPSRHYNIEEFPAVKAHLLSFGKERLEQTGKKYIINGEEIKARKKTSNKWFETQDSISYWDDFNRLWEEFRRIAKENGFSIDEEAGTSQQNGKAGATQTVTQDSFSRVEGLVTSVQIHSANIDENTEGIVPVLKGSLEAMNAIRENTEPIPQIYELLQTIKRDGLKAI